MGCSLITCVPVLFFRLIPTYVSTSLSMCPFAAHQASPPRYWQFSPRSLWSCGSFWECSSPPFFSRSRGHVIFHMKPSRVHLVKYHPAPCELPRCGSLRRIQPGFKVVVDISVLFVTLLEFLESKSCVLFIICFPSLLFRVLHLFGTG